MTGDRWGWMASPTWWAWVCVNSGSWWWTGKPGVLWSMGSQRVRQYWATELNWLLACGFATAASMPSPSPTMWSFSCSPRAPTPKQKCNGITPPHKHPQWTFCRLRVFQKNIFKISDLSPFSIQISFTLFSSPFASWLRATSPSPAPLGTLLQAHCIYVLSPVQQTPWTVACQEPLSMEFSRQKYHIPFSRGSSQPRGQTWSSRFADRFLTIWSIRKAHSSLIGPSQFLERPPTSLPFCF